MRIAIVVLGVLGLAACSRDRPAETTGLETPSEAGATVSLIEVEQIRSNLLRDHPDKAAIIRTVTIVDEGGGVITLRGVVMDKQLHQDMVNRVRQTPGVRDVRDELQEGQAQATAAPPTPEQIRIVLREERPGAPDVINALVITDEGGIVTLKGKVDDEQMRRDIVQRAKTLPNVKSVNDELQVGGNKGQGGGQGSAQGSAQTSTRADAVRAAMLHARPNAANVVNTLVIADEDGVIVLTGIVPDEKTHKALVDSAKKTPGVKNVHDKLDVSNKKQ